MYKIRKATIKDVDKIHRLGRSEPELQAGRLRFYPKRELKEWVRSRNHVSIVALKDRNIVGFLVSHVMSYAWIMPDTIMVVKSERGNGLGQKMLDHLFDEMRRHKTDFCGVFLQKNNPYVRDVFLKKGFKEDDRTFMWADRFVGHNNAREK